MKLNLKAQLAKLKLLFFHPAQFFKSVSKEKDYFSISLFFVIIYMISKIINIITFLPTTRRIFGLLPPGITGDSSKILIILSTIISYLLTLVYHLAIAFATIFIVSGIIHLGVLIIRGKKGFFNTFKPVIYSLNIGVIYSFILSLILAIVLIIKPIDLNTFTLIKSYSVSSEFILQYLIILLPSIIIISLISIIHSLYTGIIGLSLFQNISKLKAFFSIIIIPLILFLLMIIFIIGMIVLVGIASS